MPFRRKSALQRDQELIAASVRGRLEVVPQGKREDLLFGHPPRDLRLVLRAVGRRRGGRPPAEQGPAGRRGGAPAPLALRRQVQTRLLVDALEPAGGRFVGIELLHVLVGAFQNRREVTLAHVPEQQRRPGRRIVEDLSTGEDRRRLARAGADHAGLGGGALQQGIGRPLPPAADHVGVQAREQSGDLVVGQGVFLQVVSRELGAEERVGDAALLEAPADPVAPWPRQQEMDGRAVLPHQGGDLQEHVGALLLLGERQVRAGRVPVEVPDQVAVPRDPQPGLQRRAAGPAVGRWHELAEVDRLREQHAGQPAVADEPLRLVVFAQPDVDQVSDREIVRP